SAQRGGVMAILIGVYNKSGKCIAWCNSRCYSAKPISETTDSHYPCTCICGGENHGIGEMAAFKNHQRGIGMRPQDLLRFANDRGLDPTKLVAIDRLRLSWKRARKHAVA